MDKNGNESIKVSTSVALSDSVDPGRPAPCLLTGSRCSEDASWTREETISRIVEGKIGCVSDINEGGAVIRTRVLMASRNCREDNSRGKAYSNACQYQETADLIEQELTDPEERSNIER